VTDGRVLQPQKKRRRTMLKKETTILLKDVALWCRREVGNHSESMGCRIEPVLES
jgi:hypothetical protein